METLENRLKTLLGDIDDIVGDGAKERKRERARQKSAGAVITAPFARISPVHARLVVLLLLLLLLLPLLLLPLLLLRPGII